MNLFDDKVLNTVAADAIWAAICVVGTFAFCWLFDLFGAIDRWQERRRQRKKREGP